jgi:hypothetical protein
MLEQEALQVSIAQSLQYEFATGNGSEQTSVIGLPEP